MRVITFLLHWLVFVWVCLLVFRSGLYVARIISEARQSFLTFQDDPSKTHFPEIKPCTIKPTSSKEAEYVWEYRNLGVICEK